MEKREFNLRLDYSELHPKNLDEDTAAVMMLKKLHYEDLGHIARSHEREDAGEDSLIDPDADEKLVEQLKGLGYLN